MPATLQPAGHLALPSSTSSSLNTTLLHQEGIDPFSGLILKHFTHHSQCHLFPPLELVLLPSFFQSTQPQCSKCSKILPEA